MNLISRFNTKNMPKFVTELIGGELGFVQVLEKSGIFQNLYAPPSST